MQNNEYPENRIVVIRGSLQDTLKRYRQKALLKKNFLDSPIICIRGSLQSTIDRITSAKDDLD
jgi:predicted RNase H-like nuclease